jgi:hypothetical protein
MATLFVLGAPRSGTTLLSGLLEHTKYGVPFETQFIPKFFDKCDHYGNLSVQQNFEQLISDILKERSAQRFIQDLDLDAAFQELSPEITYGKIVNYLASRRIGREEHTSWGDKTPWYLIRLNCLVELFPDAQFIFIHRDGRDVALSLLEKNWGPNNIYSCAKYWQEMHQKHAEQLALLERNNQLISISYESLLADPTPKVNELYKFLGAEPGKEVVDKLCERIRSDNTNKWKSKMRTKDVLLFDSIAGETLAKFGYDVNSKAQPITHFQELWYVLHESVKKSIFLFKHNIVDSIKIKYFGKPPFHE